MPSDLKFEFIRRWSQLGKLVFPEMTPEQKQFIEAQENNYRDLEDHLNSAKSAPGALVHTVHYLDIGVAAGATEEFGFVGGYHGNSLTSEFVASASYPYIPIVHAHLSVKFDGETTDPAPNDIAFRFMKDESLVSALGLLPATFAGYRVRDLGSADAPVGVPWTWQAAWSDENLDDNTRFGFQVQSFDTNDQSFSVSMTVILYPGNGISGGGS